MSNVRHLDAKSDDDAQPRGPTFRRTRKGSEELVTRRTNLGPGQRQILLFANGKRSVEDLMSRIPEVQDNPDLLFDMESDGLIEMFDADLNEVVGSGDQPERSEKGSASEQRVPAEPEPQDSFGSIKREIEADLYDLLGRDANAAVAKLQAVDSPEALQQLMPKLLNLAKLSGGVKAGERFNSKYTRWMP